MKVIEGRISSPFGLRVHPITGERLSVHNGVDVAAPIGTEVYCPCDGVVKEVNENEREGKRLVIGDDASGLRFGFCHLSKVYWPAGTKVYRGELVALTGNTGKTTGAHCHFTVKRGGKWNGVSYAGGDWVNPCDYLEL